MAGVLRMVLVGGVSLLVGLPQAEAGAADNDRVTLEQPSDLAQGARVRVTASGGLRQQLTGNILSQDEKTLTIIDDGGQPVKVPREIVTRLDVSWGRKRHALPGLLIGAAAGGLIGAILPLCDGYNPCSTRGELLTGGVVGFGAIGALVGAFVKSDKWVEIPLDRGRVSLRAGPSRRGVGLALTLAF